MSRLSIFPDHGDGRGDALPLPKLVCNDPASIQAELADRGIGFEQWPAAHDLPPDADQSTILATYSTEVARVQRDSGYQTVDAIRMTPDHPEREVLRNKFLSEHTHAEDEVRFFVEGQGLFFLHINQEVLVTLCERGDLISVPAGTRHWFDMGPTPSFCALRFFNNSAGWVATFTGDSIAERFPRLD
ncbi:acireductone dioxygenase [Synechococcus sp. A15-24]|uniref:1,2-dihydroxy-3-keto-5-methylthiopentene dioxygenase n=1 Tax=Synechococcus sp. A15-24 TaxID=1050635 RepID=UPI00164493B6|nr:acireductone dioxygenase [Synechococcus sp. A15-24]QNJ28398.1 1/2-dihydroxy-3-keto-5-methylthiopentene dioxygenase [Synechococcus sp. A15-24]